MGIDHIVGIDLAWGTRKPDAAATLSQVNGSWQFGDWTYTHGNDELIDRLTPFGPNVLLAIDAPTACVNESGSRPVDRECTRRFRKFEAGCHPVNLKLCDRPLRLARALEKQGYQNCLEPNFRGRLMIEVYPHPAMIRLFEISKTIKYKKGLVAERRKAFRDYQSCFRKFLFEHASELTLSESLEKLLRESWSKETEDGLDAFFCSVIGYWFLTGRCQVLGDLTEGFMAVPHIK